MIELEKGKTGLGLSLAGNRDRSRTSVFVVGIDPSGAAGRDGRMSVGDELLEVRTTTGRRVLGAASWERSEPSFLLSSPVSDQRADPVRPQSPERVRHDQELRLEGQDHLHQVGTTSVLGRRQAWCVCVCVQGSCSGAARPPEGAAAAPVLLSWARS